MRKILIIGLAVFALGGCQTAQQDRALKGAVIGGVAGSPAGGPGVVAGAAAGGIIGAVTTSRGRCYVRTSSGKLRRVACR